MLEDPFKSFKFILDIDEILEIAFNRANKQARTKKRSVSYLNNLKNNEIKKIEVAFKYVNDYLLNIVKSVPDLSKLHPFYYELSEILVSNDQLKKKLGRITGILRVLDKLERQHINQIKKQNNPNQVKDTRKSAFGRMKSVLDKLDKDFKYLQTARKKLRSLPMINQSIPSIVFAGYPNVGKSSCINLLCGTKIKVAQYPFTTKEIKVGTYKDGVSKAQLIDTPGVLDRPMSQRNEIELQAITALKYIAKVIFFVIDPSVHCGFNVDEQVNLFLEIKELFQETQINIVINKIDLIEKDFIKESMERLKTHSKDNFILFSAKSGEGMDVLKTNINLISDKFQKQKMETELDFR